MITPYAVALYYLADGRYSGCIGRFSSKADAHAHAKSYMAGIASQPESAIEAGTVTLYFRSRPQQARALDTLDTVGYMTRRGSVSHYLDDLVAVVVPPSILSTELALYMATASFAFAASRAA